MLNTFKFYEYYVLFFAFIFVFLPMGFLSFFKSTLFIFLILFFLIRVSFRVKKNTLISTLLFIVLLLLQILNSFNNNFFEKEIIIEFKSFIGLFFTIVIIITSLTKNLVDLKLFIKSIIIAHVIYLILKLSIIFGFLLNISFANELIIFFSNIFGFNLLSYGIIPKITLPNDIITPLVILILIVFRVVKIRIFKKNEEVFILLLSLLAVFSGFNRYNLSILIIGILVLFTLGNNIKILKYIFYSTFIITGILLYFDDLRDILYSLWIHRISVEGGLSNSEKIYQYYLFIDRIKENFLIGHGLGTFPLDYIRDVNIRYGYEAFLFLLFYQFGFISLLILLFLFYQFYIQRFSQLKNKYLFFNFLLINLLLSVGLVNPMILNSMFAVIYTFIICSYLLIQNKYLIPK